METKLPSQPSEPKKMNIPYDGHIVPAEVFTVREYNGYQEYALIRQPNCREFTAVSLIKTDFLHNSHA